MVFTEADVPIKPKPRSAMHSADSSSDLSGAAKENPNAPSAAQHAVKKM